MTDPDTHRIDGLTLHTPPGFLKPYHIHAIARGAYEYHEMAIASRVVRPGDRVLEFGGGIGLVSRHLAGLTDAAGILSCEPNPAAAAVARDHLDAAGIDLTLRQALVVPAGAAGRMLAVDADNFLGSQMAQSDTDQAETVPNLPLPEVLAEWRPDVLVIDIEGGERDIFTGADLAGVRAIILELHPETIGGDGCLAVVRDLYRQGFALVPGLIGGQTVALVRSKTPGPAPHSPADRQAVLRAMQAAQRGAQAQGRKETWAQALRHLGVARDALPDNPFLALQMAELAVCDPAARGPLLDLATAHPATRRLALQVRANHAMKDAPDTALACVTGTPWAALAYERHLAARALMAQGRPAEAQAAAEAAALAAPALFAAHLVHAQAALAAGDGATAALAAAHATAIDPHHSALGPLRAAMARAGIA